MARPVAFGQVFGPVSTVQVPAAASESFRANSGRFVQLDAQRRATKLVNLSLTDVFGWADVGTLTTSSTAGADLIPVNCAVGAVYEMPIDASQTESQLKSKVGKSCDVVVTSDVQYADLDASTDDILQIVGYKYYGAGSGEQTVLVRLNPRLNITITGVA